MNLQELRDVQNRERTTDSLQELPDSFYADVAEYIQELKDERQRVADEVDNPWDSPRINQLSDEIESAEQVAEAVYERRVGKVVKQASFAAADIANEEGGLTAEERALYDDLVGRIKENKAHVLDVLGGEVESTSTASADADATNPATNPASATGDDARDSAGPPTDPEPGATSAESGAAAGQPETERTGDASAVDAADLMGDGTESAGAPSRTTEETPGAPNSESESDPPADADSIGDGAADESGDGDESDAARRTVRITRDVGEIFGVDERVYTLEDEDVVDLPEENAAPLVERDAAERL